MLTAPRGGSQAPCPHSRNFPRIPGLTVLPQFCFPALCATQSGKFKIPATVGLLLPCLPASCWPLLSHSLCRHDGHLFIPGNTWQIPLDTSSSLTPDPLPSQSLPWMPTHSNCTFSPTLGSVGPNVPRVA